MPYTVTKYPQGTFCWADVSSTDIAATAKFMTGLLGWSAEIIPTPQGPSYTMFSLGDKVVAGGMQMPESMKGVPSAWSNYVSVDNIDEMVTKAEKLGAKVVMPTMDVMDVGRMVCLQDPVDAYIFLWQPKKHIGAQIVNTIGAMGWNELYTKDLQKATDFYGQLFGWTFDPMKEMPGYSVIKNRGRSNGGIMQITPEMGGMPVRWMVYFTVQNAEETAKKVAELGGKVWMTKDIGVGKMVTISDPAGAPFFALELVMPPEEWKE